MVALQWRKKRSHLFASWTNECNWSHPRGSSPGSVGSISRIWRQRQTMSAGLLILSVAGLARRGSSDRERSPSSHCDRIDERLKTPPPEQSEENEPASGESPLAAMARCPTYSVPGGWPPGSSLPPLRLELNSGVLNSREALPRRKEKASEVPYAPRRCLRRCITYTD